MNFPFGEVLHFLRERVAHSLRVTILETLGVSNVLARLSSRERLSVGAAALALGGTIGYVFVIDPLWETHARLRARIVTKEREVREVAALGRTYETLRQEVDRLRPPQSGLPQWPQKATESTSAWLAHFIARCSFLGWPRRRPE